MHIDCTVALPCTADNYWHLAIIDPPYGIGESGKNHKTRNTVVRQSDGITLRRCPSTNYVRMNWDESIPDYRYFYHLFRTSCNQIIFGANYYPEIVGTPFKPPRREQFGDFLRQYPTGWIIWDKINGKSDFSDCELIHTSFDFPSYVLRYMWAGMMQGRSIEEGHIMQGNKLLNQKRIHPTEKPRILYRKLLHDFVNEGDRVVDTHGGSGSMLLAALDILEKRSFSLDWMEKEEVYYQPAMQRYQQERHIKQLKQRQLTVFE